MKKLGIALAAVIVLACAGVFGWWYFAGGHVGSGSTAFLPTVQGSCPEQPDDLSGIEGWAPGASNAARGAESERQTSGSMGGALSGGDDTTPAPSAAASTCPHLAPEAAAYFKRVEDAKAFVPTDTFDVTARAAELPQDASAITTWVRDHIHTEAYAGAMRGAGGTLQSRGGSSADKALLLSELLKAKGIETRFVHVMLSNDEAARVVGDMQHAQIAPVAAGFDAKAAYAKTGVDQDGAQERAARAADAATARTDDVLARATVPVAHIRDAFSKAGVRLGATDDDTLRALQANARDHWFVQANTNGTWTDEDPTLHDVNPGQHLGTGQLDEPQAELPDNQRTSLSISLAADVLAGSTTTQVQLAKVDAPAPALYGQPLRINVADRNAKLQTPFKPGTSFTPSIVAGSEHADGDAFDPESIGGGRIAALHLRITTVQPGRGAVTYDRVLFDRRAADGRSIDATWDADRTGTALTLEADGLVLSGDLDSAFVGIQELENARRFGALYSYAAAGGSGAQKPPADAAQAYPMEALHYFQLDRLARRELEKEGTHFYFDRPQIALVERGITSHNGSVTAYQRFDIVENTMRASGKGATDANMRRGFYDTVAERQVCDSSNDRNTLAVFDAADAQHIGAKIVVNDPLLGAAALVTEKPVAMHDGSTTAWWQADPESGSLVGRMPGGAGQAMSEYVVQLNDVSSMWTAMSFYADVLRCIAVGVTQPLQGASGAEAQNNLLNCFGNAGCAALQSFLVGEFFNKFGDDAIYEAFIYNVLDLSFNTHYADVSKSSSYTLGAECDKRFPSNSNNWTWGGSYG